MFRKSRLLHALFTSYIKSVFFSVEEFYSAGKIVHAFIVESPVRLASKQGMRWFENTQYLTKINLIVCSGNTHKSEVQSNQAINGIPTS